ncbi:MAG: hypothetical protein ACRD21_16430 [Vicinamibacteria bacterium]
MKRTETLASRIHQRLSGDRARDLTEAITEFHRAPGSSGYQAATNLVTNRLREIGIDSVRSTTYPLDGETRFLHQTMPFAWEPYHAVVRTTAPREEPLVDFREAPSCLMPWSRPTPTGGLIADLVDVGTGASEGDFAGKDLRGKVAFIRHGKHRALFAHAATEAMERGVQGILTDFLLFETAPLRTRDSLPDGVQLLRLPNATGRYEAWGCAVDRPTGQLLRELLERGPVTVHADIRCRMFRGEGQNLLATISGRGLPEESVLFIAHTSAATKPGANCAAGPALMVEIARCLHDAIRSGELPRPRRSIEFLFVIEGLGSAVFLERNRGRLHEIKTAFCLDSVGHHQEKCGSALLFYRHPDSSPSFINDYFAGVMERVPKDASWVFAEDRALSAVLFEQAPYTPWSDNHYWAAFGVPSALVMSWPDRYFHTQLLTAEMTDPKVFRAAGVCLALAAYEIADAGPDEAAAIADDVTLRSVHRLERIANRTLRDLLEASKRDLDAERRALLDEAHRKLDYLAERDARAVASTLGLSGKEASSALRERIEGSRARIEARATEAKARLMSAAED